MGFRARGRFIGHRSRGIPRPGINTHAKAISSLRKSYDSINAAPAVPSGSRTHSRMGMPSARVRLPFHFARRRLSAICPRLFKCRNVSDDHNANFRHPGDLMFGGPIGNDLPLEWSQIDSMRYHGPPLTKEQTKSLLVCVFYEDVGVCPNVHGKGCRFMHGSFPCLPYFSSYGCRVPAGQCLFSHGPLTQAQRWVIWRANSANAFSPPSAKRLAVAPPHAVLHDSEFLPPSLIPLPPPRGNGNHDSKVVPPTSLFMPSSMGSPPNNRLPSLEHDEDVKLPNIPCGSSELPDTPNHDPLPQVSQFDDFEPPLEHKSVSCQPLPPESDDQANKTHFGEDCCIENLPCVTGLSHVDYSCKPDKSIQDLNCANSVNSSTPVNSLPAASSDQIMNTPTKAAPPSPVVLRRFDSPAQRPVTAATPNRSPNLPVVTLPKSVYTAVCSKASPPEPKRSRPVEEITLTDGILDNSGAETDTSFGSNRLVIAEDCVISRGKRPVVVISDRGGGDRCAADDEAGFADEYPVSENNIVSFDGWRRQQNHDGSCRSSPEYCDPLDGDQMPPLPPTSGSSAVKPAGDSFSIHHYGDPAFRLGNQGRFDCGDFTDPDPLAFSSPKSAELVVSPSPSSSVSDLEEEFPPLPPTGAKIGNLEKNNDAIIDGKKSVDSAKEERLTRSIELCIQNLLMNRAANGNGRDMRPRDPRWRLRKFDLPLEFAIKRQVEGERKQPMDCEECRKSATVMHYPSHNYTVPLLIPLEPVPFLSRKMVPNLESCFESASMEEGEIDEDVEESQQVASGDINDLLNNSDCKISSFEETLFDPTALKSAENNSDKTNPLGGNVDNLRFIKIPEFSHQDSPISPTKESVLKSTVTRSSGIPSHYPHSPKKRFLMKSRNCSANQSDSMALQDSDLNGNRSENSTTIEGIRVHAFDLLDQPVEPFSIKVIESTGTGTREVECGKSRLFKVPDDQSDLSNEAHSRVLDSESTKGPSEVVESEIVRTDLLTQDLNIQTTSGASSGGEASSVPDEVIKINHVEPLCDVGNKETETRSVDGNDIVPIEIDHSVPVASGSGDLISVDKSLSNLRIPDSKIIGNIVDSSTAVAADVITDPIQVEPFKSPGRSDLSAVAAFTTCSSDSHSIAIGGACPDVEVGEVAIPVFDVEGSSIEDGEILENDEDAAKKKVAPKLYGSVNFNWKLAVRKTFKKSFCGSSSNARRDGDGFKSKICSTPGPSGELAPKLEDVQQDTDVDVNGSVTTPVASPAAVFCFENQQSDPVQTQRLRCIVPDCGFESLDDCEPVLSHEEAVHPLDLVDELVVQATNQMPSRLLQCPLCSVVKEDKSMLLAHLYDHLSLPSTADHHPPKPAKTLLFQCALCPRKGREGFLVLHLINEHARCRRCRGRHADESGRQRCIRLVMDD